ncbi:hypothetical protein BH10PSE7_BH10PSE7_24710 [soil metagenome]
MNIPVISAAELLATIIASLAGAAFTMASPVTWMTIAAVERLAARSTLPRAGQRDVRAAPRPDLDEPDGHGIRSGLRTGDEKSLRALAPQVVDDDVHAFGELLFELTSRAASFSTSGNATSAPSAGPSPSLYPRGEAIPGILINLSEVRADIALQFFVKEFGRVSVAPFM